MSKSKPWYTDAVRHMIRAYINHIEPEYMTETYYRNWFAVEKSFKKLPKNQREMISKIYRSNDIISDIVRLVSTESHIPVRTVWELTENFERDVATARGLIESWDTKVYHKN